MILLGSGACYCVGCFGVAVAFLRQPTREHVDLAASIDRVKLKRVTIGLYTIGMILLAGYLAYINARFTLGRFLTEPWHLRAAIMQGEVSWFLRYFYFTMPAAVLALVHLRITSESGLLMRIIIVTSLIYGMATTGRTAVIWLMAWLACAYLYLPTQQGGAVWGKAKGAIALGAFGIVSLLFFLAAGSWIGRTYKNSELIRTSAVSATAEPFIVPYQYATANIPAFQNLLMEEPAYTYGKYTALPLIKTLAAFTSEVQDLSEVSEFTKTPFLGNTYTYLWPYYLDFGLPGVFVCPFVLGVCMSLLYFWMKTTTVSLALLFLNSSLATVIIFSFIANTLISSPTWWFCLIAPIIGRVCLRRQTNKFPEFLLEGRS